MCRLHGWVSTIDFSHAFIAPTGFDFGSEGEKLEDILGELPAGPVQHTPNVNQHPNINVHSEANLQGSDVPKG